ncbi:MAG: bifunctional phosphopantothenoylcysteine decarboxylase/phosphopantothenate--cysteine ligase CoaBC [Gammaproteobacteria bacterium]|nr:bifunctional phosphopantothenoylcysteine decarboxylase/phosphopantothenate--cysteine ligase CoaBC [Gammaproteobacteria bacterium]MDH4253746.1 bifunctional phosphopantothenoylcysteine decarboxylase/phosphopantothenate--cysteine ligase CoaBC [Gammaproteobacteria bacterium]MDH5309675.1 bifunctional phosphopantothenoylcysteine decarboxylase/phosphopantothenate--cysteine ligase CoaBC [Gammaproteobacteria bacterium]
MNYMKPRNILLGVTGGIAAYKTPDLVRRLRERGADVQVVMTDAAAHFVTSTALQAVSGRPVRTSLWDESAEAAMSHIELARWADRILVAPATADFLAALATGGARDLLSTLCLATEAPILVAPAMNHVMWANPAVQANRQLIESRGIRVLGPADGDQACGETGPGRMLEPAELAALAMDAAGQPVANGPLAGKRVLITAGPTREAIDAVRYISNRSSGRMGYALAAAASEAGARVTLLSGPVGIETPAGVERVFIESAEELLAATHARIDDVDVFIAAAAVADYRPRQAAAGKLKKKAAEMSVELVRCPDVLASVARLQDGPFTVGFAAETDRLREHALSKLEGKQLDMIVANEVGADRGFDQEANAVHVFWRTGERAYPMTDKTKLARQLIELIAERYDASFGSGTATELPALASRD